MKILKIFGIVVGLHAAALIMIFANPGCSSTGNAAPRPAPADTAPPKTDAGPAIALPGATAAPESAAEAPAPSPSSDATAAVVIAPGLFTPTRPGTPAAAALEAQPDADVTPATTYVVGRGDSLWTIARKNHVKVSVLAKANGIHTGTPLRLGQKLIIPGAAPASGGFAPESAEPPPTHAAPARADRASAAAAGGTTYRVRPGDTLGGIARKFRVTRAELGTANNITDPQKIRPGQVLVIPAGGRTGARAATARAGAAEPALSTDSGIGATAQPAPAPDLDAGLKPVAPGQVPAIRLDDTGTASAAPEPKP